ncbi:MAG: sugar ABC transporter permease [Chloroflexi bacterium]|nr:sugar ABC transporter permease [Chloroflexota bacterium]
MPNWLGATARQRREAIEGYLFTGPVLLGLVFFALFPVVASLYTSLNRWDLIQPMEFVGLKNYVDLFDDDTYKLTVRNTLYFSAGIIPLGIVGALCLALLVDRQRRGVNLFRTLYFMPVVTSVVAVGLVWAWLLDTDFGLVNTLLGQVGIAGPKWLTSVEWAMPSVILITAWHGVGYNMVIFLAGLQGIPDHLYEAAQIDGANAWQRFASVTFPLLTPTTFFIAVMSVISSFQAFGLIYIVTMGGPANATNVLVFYLWQNAFTFQGKMGYASAMAWVLGLAILALTLAQMALAKRWVFYE